MVFEPPGEKRGRDKRGDRSPLLQRKPVRYPPIVQLAYRYFVKTTHTEAPQAAASDGTLMVGAHILVVGDQRTLAGGNRYQQAPVEERGKQRGDQNLQTALAQVKSIIEAITRKLSKYPPQRNREIFLENIGRVKVQKFRRIQVGHTLSSCHSTSTRSSTRR